MSAEASADLPVRDYNRAVRRAAIVILAVGIIARVFRFALAPSIWGDEAMLGLNVAGRSFIDLTRTLDFYQVCPLLFLWAERAVYLTLGDGEWAMRLMPLLAGVAALFAFWEFARRTVSPTAAVLAVGLLAAARWPVVMCSTLKPYSVDLFWATALLAVAANWHRRPQRLWLLLLLTAAVPVAVASSFPVVFVAGAISLYLLPVAWRHPDRRAKVLYVAFNVLLVAAFAGCLAVHGREKQADAGRAVETFMLDYWRHGFPPESVLGYPAWLMERLTGRMMAYPIGDKNGGSTLTLVFFVAGVWRTWRAGNRALVVLCMVPFALNLVAALMHKYPFGGCCRLSQHLAPAVCLMAGVGWASGHAWLASRLAGRLKLVRASLVLLAGYAVGQIVFDAVAPDHDPVSKLAKNLYGQIRDDLRPEDRIAFDPSSPVYRTSTQDNQELHWYVTRFRDRNLPPGDVPSPADVPGRLWTICIDQDDPEGREVGADFVRRVRAAGWVPVADAVHSEKPEPKHKLWHNCRVTVFRRPESVATDRR